MVRLVNLAWPTILAMILVWQMTFPNPKLGGPVEGAVSMDAPNDSGSRAIRDLESRMM